MATITPTFKQQGSCGSTGNVYISTRYGLSTGSTVADIGGSGDGTSYRNIMFVRFDSLPSNITKANMTITFDIANSDFPDVAMTFYHRSCANFTNSTTGANRPTSYGTRTSSSIKANATSHTVDVTDHLKLSLENGSKCLILSADTADNRRRVSKITLTYSSTNITFNGEEVNTIVFNGQTVESLVFNGTTLF